MVWIAGGGGGMFLMEERYKTFTRKTELFYIIYSIEETSAGVAVVHTALY